MDTKCSEHAQPAIIYCMNHTMLCCGKQCFKEHSKHDTLSIDEYNEAIVNVNEYTQLKNARRIVDNAKSQVSILFDKLKNRITSKLSTLRGNHNITLFNQLVAKAKRNLSPQIGLESKIQDLIKAVNQFCANIESVQLQFKIAPPMLSQVKKHQTDLEKEVFPNMQPNMMAQPSPKKEQVKKEAIVPVIALPIRDESNQVAVFGQSVKRAIVNAMLLLVILIEESKLINLVRNN